MINVSRNYLRKFFIKYLINISRNYFQKITFVDSFLFYLIIKSFFKYFTRILFVLAWSSATGVNIKIYLKKKNRLHCVSGDYISMCRAIVTLSLCKFCPSAGSFTFTWQCPKFRVMLSFCLRTLNYMNIIYLCHAE